MQLRIYMQYATICCKYRATGWYLLRTYCQKHSTLNNHFDEELVHLSLDPF